MPVPADIPEVVIDRLPIYYRWLSRMDDEGRSTVSSQELGDALGVTPAQIRKDLAYFGRFGKQGSGYSVVRLVEELRLILGLNRRWRMVLVGVGRLGRAIASYQGFGPDGFDLVGVYDAGAEEIGGEVGGLIVQDVRELETSLRGEPAEIGIVAVPAEFAQEVIDSLVRAGVRSILNYAPITVQVPRGVRIRRIDPLLSLQSMTYHLSHDAASRDTAEPAAVRASA
ncbi:MAG: redox-sensing transcriptional repressor Rex [Chloroflexi bacterium]|nr:redox-sensing transcriptional repressor Rex [Chloroflexota bacterium]MYE47611.1 redox-sensing transcriptional repressor Rex [Chloroflexota bacterium]